MSVIQFPVLNEASLKGEYPQDSALDLLIPADCPFEVLSCATDRIFSHMEMIMNQVRIEDLAYVASELTRASDRLIEIARAMHDAPSSPEAGVRLRAYFLEPF